MREFVNNRYLNIIPSLLVKMIEKANKYNDMVNFSIGEPDMHTDKSIIEACCRAGVEGHTHYLDSKGDFLLRERLAQKYNIKYGCNYDINNICITNGGMHALHIIFKALINPGDEIIVFGPYFTPYKYNIEDFDGVVREVPTFSKHGFQIDIELLKKSVNSRTKALVLNSPNNPTGAVYSRETIDKIVDLAIENDLAIIFDDVYESLVFDEYYSPCIREDAKERVIIAGSFSKTYAMTGWRLGYVMGSEKIIKGINLANTNLVYCVNSLTQRAGAFALKEGDSIVKNIRDTFYTRVKMCHEEVTKISPLKCIMPKGAFYLFVDISGLGCSSLEFAEQMIEKAHVLVVPGNAFGQAGEGYVRLACTLNQDKLIEGIKRLRNVIK